MLKRMIYLGSLLALLASGCTSTTDNPANEALYVQMDITGKGTLRLQAAPADSKVGILATYLAQGTQTHNDSMYTAINHQRISYFDVVGGQIVEVASKPYVDIIFLKTFTAQPITEDLDVMVAMGPMSYGALSKQLDGAIIEYRDSSGTIWSTVNAQGDQTGSTFNVTRHDRIAYLPGQVTYGHFLTQGNFTCKLYDDGGNVITVSGTFSIRTIHYV